MITLNERLTSEDVSVRNYRRMVEWVYNVV